MPSNEHNDSLTHSNGLKKDNEKNLQSFIFLLLDIELLPLLLEISKKNALLNSKYANLAGNASNYSIVINILMKPFETRFKFHFLLNRKTNNYEKPEWFLNQILKWLKLHEEFLNSFIQPIFKSHAFYKDKSIVVIKSILIWQN